MLKKLFMEIKQRKTKKKINKIKENLVFIDRINLLIEKIENFKINFRTSPHMYLWRKQWNWMSSTMLFKQNRIV
ncbi:hypothetical protein [Spiroplasma ixodetis]|uniref:hypothetical protein n=1 Tax=Spiroplasma ixodetis TaxID=2141 RepID=UPI0025763CEB|nr:hypothetical protein [Spiroplasma ixodetis]WJG70919.1 hypothetical protein SIXOD_v1c22110 [Spiroplasma ixodetis Y32]